MSDLSNLADVIAKTLSPDPAQRKSAEAFLDGKSSTPGFAVGLLQLIALDSAPQHIRQATAVYMKNHTIKTYSNPTWEAQPPEERNAIKGAIVDIMLSAPVVVRRQLSEVLAIVSEHEYPTHWPNLVPELSVKLTAIIQSALEAHTAAEIISRVDWIRLQGILETLHAIFERYPERMRSDELYTEINYSLKHTQEHVKAFLGILNKVLDDKFDANDHQVIDIVLNNADLLCKIFYCLSWQEIPAYFEDHLQEYMTELRKLLLYQSNRIDAISEDEPGGLDKIHAAILEVTNLYATKFDEEFRPYLQQFLSDAWGLLVRRSNSVKYDGVVTTGIKFLTSVSRSPDSNLFSSESSLSEVCKQIVIPNMELRNEDMELFEDNPVEYVRRDLEGSDTETRRRGAVELVKGLCTHFEEKVTTIFSSYAQEMLSPQADWRRRDTAIYIVTALGWKSGTLAGGASETSSLINVVDFFDNMIMPELTKCATDPTKITHPIFAADLIKFVISFRNQIPKESCGKVIMLCGALLGAWESVVKTYAAACIERILSVKDQIPQANGNRATSGTNKIQRVQRMTQTDLEPILPTFIPAVLKALKESKRADEYLMRLVLRFCAVAQSSMGPYVETLLSTLTEIFIAVTANPANPLFNHYLFEAISALLRFNGNENTLPKFEAALLGPMCNILRDDVTEFAPYVFQVMSQLMLCHSGPLPSTYNAVMGPILNPAMWERKGYIPGMVQFIEVYISKAKESIEVNNQLNQILGVFQKLLASKATDHHGLHMLDKIFEVFDLNILGDRLKTILDVLMMRLTVAKTPKYVVNLICTLSLFILKFGVTPLRTAFDTVQPNVLEGLLRQVWLPGVVKIRNNLQRRLCALALSEIGCGSELCTQSPYFELWPAIINTNVALTEGIVLDQGEAEEGDAEEEATNLGAGESYSAAHSQLKWGVRPKAAIRRLVTGKDPRAYIATKVSEFTANHGAQFNAVFQEKVDARAREALVSYAAPQAVS